MTQIVVLNPVANLGGSRDPVDVWIAGDPPDGIPPDLVARIAAGQAATVHVSPGSRIIVSCPDEDTSFAGPAGAPPPAAKA